MFGRRIDIFGFEDDFHKFMGQNPPGHEDRPHHPPFGGPPPFGPLPPFPGFPFRGPLPMNRESFQEIREYFILLLISGYPEGITGYQIQEKYKVPRGTLIRTLQDLDDKGYLTTKEEIIEGRANKFYFLTEQGKNFVEELNLKWANLFFMMSEFNPGEGLKVMMFDKIENFESKDDAIDFFRGLRSWSKELFKLIEKNIEKLKKAKNFLDVIIAKIENMDILDKEQVKDLLDESQKIWES
ncbi:MAG: PadR family transcriptional regulator [Promethearchaeota archaeon]